MLACCCHPLGWPRGAELSKHTQHCLPSSVALDAASQGWDKVAVLGTAVSCVLQQKHANAFKVCGFILSHTYSGINRNRNLTTAAIWEEVGTKYNENRHAEDTV